MRAKRRVLWKYLAVVAFVLCVGLGVGLYVSLSRGDSDRPRGSAATTLSASPSPRYGWIPLDTSAGRLTGYLPDLSEAESNAYRDFFFANQEPFRFVVQRDTDQPLMPKADGLVLLPMAIQWPAALCSTRPKPQEP